MVSGGFSQLVGYGSQDNYLPQPYSFNTLFTYLTDEELMNLIKNHKCGINDKLKHYNQTLLYKAIENNSIKAVEYLLEKGADPNTQGCFYAAFNYEQSRKNFEIARLLLKYGADLKKSEHSYINRLMYYENFDFAKELLQLGALIKPLDIFSFYSKKNQLQFLVENGALLNGQHENMNVREYFLYHMISTSLDDYDSDSDSETDMPGDFYVFIYIRESIKEPLAYISKKLAQRRWTFVKCYVLFLGVHQRAVVSANHPNRLKQLNYFEISE